MGGDRIGNIHQTIHGGLGLIAKNSLIISEL
jgi:hypothetical protein